MVIRKLFLGLMVSVALGGCAHKELLAPCDPRESPVPIGGGEAVKPTADCGVMKEVNQ